MPELPEVEVTRRQISGLLIGRTIERVQTTAASYFFLTRPDVLAKRLTGRAVRALERRGKYLIATLDDDASLLLHLGMTGQLFSAGSASLRLLSSTAGATLSPEHQLAAFEPDLHTHLRVTFTDRGPGLYFRDARKFGKVQWLAPGERSARLDKLGVDALLATGDDLYAATRKRSAPIKTVLLDQQVLAGVGNIYADEALFLAGVKPTRAARTVKLERCAAIVAAAQQVMLRSIETGGSSISDYVRPDGSDGGYQDERRVYAREGEACSRCGGRIKRVVLATRSSFFCPRCQR
jgi:formamidopyrimidine-DNA glycosylase